MSETPVRHNMALYTPEELADPFERYVPELDPYPESAVNLLRHLPDAPRIDVRVRDEDAQYLRQTCHTLGEVLYKNLANWYGPYMNEHVYLHHDPETYVGPLNAQGEIMDYVEYCESRTSEDYEREGRYLLTPLKVAERVAHKTVIRERLAPRLAELGRKIPELLAPAEQLITAMDADLEASAKLLPELRKHFCDLGLCSTEWRKEAWKARETWWSVLDWDQWTASPIMRAIRLGDYDLKHTPLYVSEETLVASGMSVGTAKQCLRVLRAAVDEGRVGNELSALVTFAHAHVGTRDTGAR